MIIKRKAASVIPPLDADTYGGTLIGIVDVGEQEFQGKYREQLILVFEIEGETVEVDGALQPRWLSRIFTASLNQKANLYAVLTSWLGGEIEDDEFDLSTLLGQHAMLAVSVKTSKDGSPYNFIDGIMRPPKAMKIGDPQSETFEFCMHNPKTWDMLQTLPDWMRSMVERSPSWAALQENSGETITPEAAQTKTAERKPAF